MDEAHELNLSDPEAYIRAKSEAAEVVSEAVEAGQPVVSVLPGTIAGPGDRKPTPNGQTLLRYLKHPPGLRFPVVPGGLNIVDVEDVAQGHILAMDKGVVGEQYILGGDNLTYTQIFEMLADITGLAEPSKPNSPGLARLVGVLWELSARYRGGQPIVTSRIARDYVGSNVWVTSEKAETQLGYTHRSAREALARSVRWFLDNGYVSEHAASDQPGACSIDALDAGKVEDDPPTRLADHLGDAGLDPRNRADQPHAAGGDTSHVADRAAIEGRLGNRLKIRHEAAF
jgi:dihydroflavonol-4-reductase